MTDRLTVLHGDALAMLKTLPDASVQMCCTSPPYYGLRDYQVEWQIGLEDSPAAYVERLVEAFREVRRVLKDDGVLFVNLGDTYAASGCGGNPPESPHKKQSSNRGSEQADGRNRLED